MSSSHHMSVLGDKGCTLRRVDKDIPRGISRGPYLCPLDMSIKDKIGKGEITIQYCPTVSMWVDINTKALQGSLFYKMQARLMGVDENYHDNLERLAIHPDLLP